jgi:hypothetical protein
MGKWIAILWIPLGSIYIFWYKYMYIGGVTIKELYTDPQYRRKVVDSGIFGPFTPIMNYLVRKEKKGSPEKKIHVVLKSHKQLNGAHHV